jgi:hypothetical protein
MNKRQFCLIFAIFLGSVGYSLRIYNAYMVGNIWLAFTTDSFMGFPYFHILALISIPFWLIGFGAVFDERKDGKKSS